MHAIFAVMCIFSIYALFEPYGLYRIDPIGFYVISFHFCAWFISYLVNYVLCLKFKQLAAKDLTVKPGVLHIKPG